MFWAVSVVKWWWNRVRILSLVVRGPDILFGWLWVSVQIEWKVQKQSVYEPFLKNPRPQTRCRRSCLSCPEGKESTFPHAFQTAEAFTWKIQKGKGVPKQALELRNSLQPAKKPEYVPCSSLPPREVRLWVGWRAIHTSHMPHWCPHEKKTLFHLKARHDNYLCQQPKAGKE